jgi:hypothetical protein
MFESKREFRSVFCDPSNHTQFEVSVSMTEDRLDSIPSMDEHLASFRKVFSDME